MPITQDRLSVTYFISTSLWLTLRARFAHAKTHIQGWSLCKALSGTLLVPAIMSHGGSHAQAG